MHATPPTPSTRPIVPPAAAPADPTARLRAMLAEPGAERLRNTQTRLAQPGAEVVVMDTITTRDGQTIRRFVAQGDHEGLREHAHWIQTFSKQHPEGYTSETRSLVINRRQLSDAAWRGANEGLQRAVFRSLDYHNMSYLGRFFDATVRHMPLDQLMQHVDIDALLDRPI
jgi:hypothetical protein